MSSPSSRRQTAAATVLFLALTFALTWPQVRWIGSRAVQHQDIYFNMWRLGWIAHALAHAPATLFDGNIFYPERRTLTFSDAILVEGLLGAPLLWAGLPPVLVHNLLLLGAIVASAAGMFVLIRHLTGSVGAGLTAGIIFGFAPYRFEHYMHLELQWTVWVPWAFWALHRALETGALKFGILTGLFVSLQMLSSIYYGVFLATLLPLVAMLLMLPLIRHRRLLKPVGVLAAGALLAAIICGAYAVPYLTTKAQLGGRPQNEIVMFSARASNYLVATPDNVVWGGSFAGRGRMERRLFPGALALLLALVGLLLRPPPAAAIAYLIGMVAAFELSLGLSGFSYRFLYDHVPLYQGFRALARAGVFVLFFVAALAGYGYSAIEAGLSRRVRHLLIPIVCAVLMFEYRVRPLALIEYPNEPSRLYAWLAEQPRGVVAELPMRSGSDPRYTYLSTFHWQPMVNGYSGFYPESYVERLEAMDTFPDDRSLRRLRSDGVRYVVVHLGEYKSADRQQVIDSLTGRYGLVELERFDEPPDLALVFALR